MILLFPSNIRLFFADFTFLSMFASSKRPEFPAKHSIRHIRRLSKAIAGVLYPVLSDHCGQVFFDISAAVRRYDNCLIFSHLCYDGKEVSIGRMDQKHHRQGERETLCGSVSRTGLNGAADH